MMKIYHGTKEVKSRTILRRGIKPRYKSKGNWTHTYVSRVDMVYFSVAYPFYFALNAKGDGRLVVFEVESDLLDESLFCPDEDFIVRRLQEQGNKKDIGDLHSKVRKDLHEYSHHWEDSLEGLGNMCYQGVVPPQAITRYCLCDPQQRPAIAMMMADPVISLMNFAICKAKYTGLVAWMFGDREDLRIDPLNLLPPEDKEDEFTELQRKQREYWDEQAKDRTGIEVHQMEVLV